MTRAARGAALWALLLLAACAESEPEAPLYAAPAHARAALVLEPPNVAVGEMAALELAVVTKPEHSVRPLDLPDRVAGFWLVERQAPEIAKEPSRWIHTTRLLLRAVEVGRFEFPGGSVEIGAPDGGSAVLHYDALPLEVVSVLGADPGRPSPYGVRTLPFAPAGGPGTLVAFAAGAILALAGVSMLLLVRRRLAARGAPPPAPPSAFAPAWEEARQRLAAARDALASDRHHALDLAARALRGYAVRRFGGDATVRTCEELALAKPPFTLTTRWPRFLALLTELDAARFPSAPPDAAQAAALVEAALAFVEETVPAEAGS